MEHMTINEAAEKWQITPRRVQALLQQGTDSGRLPVWSRLGHFR